jgi:DMSO/TMAO reductase YedYZ molybdopterin-dependent catalytic subunit
VVKVLERRWFLRQSLFAGATLLVGCGDDDVDVCADDPFASGEMVGTAAFEVQPSVVFGSKQKQGWDARLYYDLSQLDAEGLVTPNDQFYIRTERPDLLTTAPADWTIRIHGLVASEVTLTMADLAPLVAPQGVHVLECSGNWDGGGFGLMSAAEWSGAALSEVLAKVTLASGAARVRISGFDEHSVPSANGHSTPGASWIFTTDQLAQAFLATEMNGVALPPDHGEPVRLFVPGWYGCCCIKWVDEIEIVSDDAPATSQMQEFASRTHQAGVPDLARDYRPATMDQAAMPVRIEKWRVDGAIRYRVVGIMWGGYQPTSALSISYDGGASYEPVELCAGPSNTASWSMWWHRWQPERAGSYAIRMAIDDPAIPTRRLDMGFYDRVVVVDEV